MSGSWRGFFRDLWILARPYWFSEDRWPARGLLTVIVGMNLGLVYLNVVFNSWNNLFYNALQDKNFDAFLHQLLRFCWLAVIFIVIAVYRTYLRQMLQIRWRQWLTRHYLDGWMGGRPTTACSSSATAPTTPTSAYPRTSIFSSSLRSR